MAPMRMSLRSFEPRHFGTGWMSGVASAALGLLGLGAVACFHYPSLLTVPELRSVYPLPYVRALLHLVLVGAFTLGVVSIYLRQNKALGTAGHHGHADCGGPRRIPGPGRGRGRG